MVTSCSDSTLGTCVHPQLLQSGPTRCNPADWSPRGSSVHGILQARILEWVAISSSRGSSWPRDWTRVSRVFPHWQAGSLLLSPLGSTFSSVAQSCPTLQPHALQHARFPTTPGASSNSCPLSQPCHPTISSSVIPFSSCLQSPSIRGLFKWVSSSHQVAKVLELQLQHQSSQWIFRTDFL